MGKLVIIIQIVLMVVGAYLFLATDELSTLWLGFFLFVWNAIMLFTLTGDKKEEEI